MHGDRGWTVFKHVRGGDSYMLYQQRKVLYPLHLKENTDTGANGTETVAVPEEDGSYKLHGYKWFSSATDANVTFTLARVMNSCGSTVPGTRGIINHVLSENKK